MDFTVKYDVAVVGAGVAGIAAALAAARRGHKVALIEKQTIIGGLATSGLVYIYLPLCDGKGTQVSFGLAEKLLRTSVKYSPAMDIESWKTDPKNFRFRTTFSPAACILAFEELLLEKGVEIWYDSDFIAIEKNTADNSDVIIRNKGGNGRFSAKVIIDATGDAEVARECGCPFVQGENLLAFWSIENDEENNDETWSRMGKSHLKGLIKGIIKEDYLPYHALDPRGTSDFIIESRNYARSVYSTEGIDKEKRFPVLIPSMPDFRTSARIESRRNVPHDTHNCRFEDSIGMSADWCSIGTVQEIPYSALIPEKGTNIIVAGRCIGAENYAWELTRSIPACAVSGEAAGIAAALTVQNKTVCAALDIKLLQNKLYNRGCKLHLTDVNLPYRNEPGYIAPNLNFQTH